MKKKNNTKIIKFNQIQQEKPVNHYKYNQPDSRTEITHKNHKTTSPGVTQHQNYI